MVSRKGGMRMAKQKFHFSTGTPVEKKPEEKIMEAKADQEQTEVKADQGIVGRLVGQLSEEKEQSSFEIKYIPRNMLKDNKKIFYPKYSKEKREEMKQSILHFGLQQNLVVMYIRSENEYVVETGHNRMYSIDELIEDFKDYQDKESDEYKLYLKNVDEYSKRGYPCKVAGIIEEEKTYEVEENEDLSNVADEVIDSEIRARITNDIRRSDDEITPADRAKNIERLSKLYTRKNFGKKRTEQINVNEQIAKDLGINKRQVANYKSIGKLIPGLRKAFNDNQISLKDGSSYAQLSEDEQQTILTLIESGKKVSRSEVDALKNEREKLETDLRNKKDEVLDLQGEIENLKDKLKSKEKPEVIIKDDPNVPIMEKRLKEKENELQKMQAEMQKIRSQNEHRRKMDAAQSDLVKKDMALRNAFEECRNAITKVKNLSEDLKKSYNGLEDQDIKDLAILNAEDINQRIRNLMDLIK